MSNRIPIVWCALTFVAVSAALGAFALRSEVLYDTDSYFHLAMGQLYAAEGVVDELTWTRFSVLRDGIGDKEFLFHLLLVPFAALFDGSLGGRLALALLNGAVAALIVFLGWRAVGRWALCAPLLCLLASQDYIDRVIRLRPELLALVLFLVATDLASRDRMKSLGVASFVFALSYTAIHALLALAVLWFVGRLLLLREFRPGLLAAPIIGAGLGLIAHPHFPYNLVIWKIQTIDFFRFKSVLDVGTEIQPATTEVLLRNNWGWVAALCVLALGVRPTDGDDAEADSFRRSSLTYGLTAFAFVGLTLLMHRFTIYAVPFVLLAAAFEAARRGLRPGPLTHPIGRVPQLPTVALLLIVTALPAAGVVRQLWGMATATGGEITREEDWQRLGASLPTGTRVAADWGDAQPLTFFAPHLEYLNVLDPVFMALPYPERHRALRDLLEGKSPDPIATLVESLDSQVFVASLFLTPPDVRAAWLAHPQIEPVYSGYMMAFRARPPTSVHNGSWKLSPPGSQPPVEQIDPAAPLVEPHPASGYLNLSDSPNECNLLSTEPLPRARRYELAPWGPTELWVGPERILTLASSARRTAGSGLDLEIPGGGPITVWTCRDAATGRAGFSLRPL